MAIIALLFGDSVWILNTRKGCYKLGITFPPRKQANNGRITLKTKWQENALLALWLDSESIDEFAQRVGISVGRALSLDKGYAAVFGIEAAKSSKSRATKTLEDLLGL